MTRYLPAETTDPVHRGPRGDRDPEGRGATAEGPALDRLWRLRRC
ncbi:hypothetical protein ACRAWD_10395 [Caulobacter segnis]